MATLDPLLYLLELAGQTYRVTTIEGEEALSRPFRFEITLHVEPEDPLDPDEVVGGDAALILSRGGALRRIAGVVTRVQRAATRTGEAGGGRVRLTLEPRLATARHRVDIRVFRDRSAPRIVAEVLAFHGVPVIQKLAGSYVERPYCVQMRESDLDFCARLLEDEGIFYLVDDDGNVVLGDFPAAYQDGPGALPFRHDSGLDVTQDSIHEVGWEGRATAGKVSLRDFNPELPNLDMDAGAPGPTAWGPEWYDYPGEYELPAQGRAKAALRAEALACQKRRLAGKSAAALLRPGARFQLVDAPAGVDDGEYVAVRVAHAWDRAKDSFSLSFEALASGTAYRPPVETFVPTLVNPLTGFVTGPAGADIHTDPWGRVKVHFPWDRLQPKDDTCSHWIPVLQDNTGRSSAMPRIGWEVLCHFLEGDPDRPVVLGRVFNASDPFMEDLPQRKTRTSLQSLSSPREQDGITGYNMIRFDDVAGGEAIDVHAQRDQNIVVANDQREQIDAVEARVVKGNEQIKIGSDEKVVVTVDSVGKVDGNQTVSIGGSRTATVTGTHTDNVRLDHTLTIGGSHLRSMGTDDNVAVAKNMKESIGGAVLEGSVKTNTVTGGNTSVLAVGGAIVEIARLGKSEGTSKGRVEAVGGVTFSKAGETIGTRAEVSRTTTVGGIYSVKALKEILLAGLQKLTTTALTTTLKAPSITLKVGETVIHMKEGKIHMKAEKEIAFVTEAENKQAAATSTQI